MKSTQLMLILVLSVVLVSGCTGQGAGETITPPGSLEDTTTTSIVYTTTSTNYVSTTTTTIATTTTSSESVSEWVSVDVGSKENLYDIFFIDSDIGWIVGDRGTMFKTTNGGETWTDIFDGTLEDFLHVRFVNSDDGWVFNHKRSGTFLGNDEVYNTGEFQTTNNGGSSWTTFVGPSGSASGNHAPFPISKDVAFVYAYKSKYNGELLKTVDGGENWVRSWKYPLGGSIKYVLDIRGIYFVDENTGWAVGGNRYLGIILKTTDGGETWEEYVLDLEGDAGRLGAVYFVDENTGWAIGDGGVVVKTTDGGNTWNVQREPGNGVFQDIYFVDENTGWAIGRDGTGLYSNDVAFRTTDGGETWELMYVDLRSWITLVAMHFSDPNTGWIVGYEGTVLKYTG